MKTFAALAILLVSGLAVAAPAAAAPQVCLKTELIDTTTVVNPKTVLFRMKDGKVWRSDLRSPCLGLKFNGFVYETHFDEVCGGSQAIRVLRSGEVCVLGPFSPDAVGQHS
jgi:hypothetical protein